MFFKTFKKRFSIGRLLKSQDLQAPQLSSICPRLKSPRGHKLQFNPAPQPKPSNVLYKENMAILSNPNNPHFTALLNSESLNNVWEVSLIPKEKNYTSRLAELILTCKAKWIADPEDPISLREAVFGLMKVLEEKTPSAEKYKSDAKDVLLDIYSSLVRSQREQGLIENIERKLRITSKSSSIKHSLSS